MRVRAVVSSTPTQAEGTTAVLPSVPLGSVSSIAVEGDVAVHLQSTPVDTVEVAPGVKREGAANAVVRSVIQLWRAPSPSTTTEVEKAEVSTMVPPPESPTAILALHCPVVGVLQMLRSRKIKTNAVKLVLDQRVVHGEDVQQLAPASTLSAVLTFEDLAQRESFLESVVAAAEQERAATLDDRPSQGGVTTQTRKRGREHSTVVEDNDDGEKRTDAEVLPGDSLEVELSHFFSHVQQQGHQANEFSGGEGRAAGSSPYPVVQVVKDEIEKQRLQQHRGVYEVAAGSHALEAILLDRQTWQLKPLTEQMEHDLLRQIPRLAELFHRFVRSDEATNNKNDNNKTESETALSGVLKNEEGQGRALNADLSASAPVTCTRVEFWRAVVRQYFCFAHTFLEVSSSEEDAEEEVENNASGRSKPTVFKKTAHPQVVSGKERQNIGLEPNSTHEVYPADQSSVTHLLSLNQASWQALPKSNTSNLGDHVKHHSVKKTNEQIEEREQELHLEMVRLAEEQEKKNVHHMSADAIAFYEHPLSIFFSSRRKRPTLVNL